MNSPVLSSNGFFYSTFSEISHFRHFPNELKCLRDDEIGNTKKITWIQLKDTKNRWTWVYTFRVNSAPIILCTIYQMIVISVQHDATCWLLHQQRQNILMKTMVYVLKSSCLSSLILHHNVNVFFFVWHNVICNHTSLASVASCCKF